MASLKDIAQHAGVSVRTVSRALRGEGYVRAATRQLVLQVAAEMGYRPNLAARALRTGRSHEVAVVAGSMDELHVQKLVGFERVLRQAGYSVVLLFEHERPLSDDETLADAFDSMLARRVAGAAIFPGVRTDGRFLERLQQIPIPLVLIDIRGVYPNLPLVQIDRQQGVYDAVSMLHRSGRQRIAYLGSTREKSRRDGYMRAVEELGLEALIVAAEGNESTQYDVGREAAEQVLAMDPRPDALQCYTDIMATGVLSLFHERGIRVPKDIAVIGFDNRGLSQYCWPRLSTVAQPNVEVGETAARMLLAQLEGQDAPEGDRSVTLPTQLVLREST